MLAGDWRLLSQEQQHGGQYELNVCICILLPLAPTEEDTEGGLLYAAHMVVCVTNTGEESWSEETPMVYGSNCL